MADSELWSLATWEHDGKEHGFLVKSIRDGKTVFIGSKTEAEAEVVHEDEAHYKEIASAGTTEILKSVEDTQSCDSETNAQLAGVSKLWTVTLSDRSIFFFGTDEYGLLMTNVCINPAMLVVTPPMVPEVRPGRS